MDNLTHTLYGLALAKSGLDRATPRATLALMLGANLPDADIISIFWGDISYLKYHRGITHSLIGVVLGAFVFAAIICFLSNRLLKGEPAQWWRLCGLSGVGIGSHVLLDYTNSYGIRPFLPFSSRWYAWDIAFIVDPWILLALVLGLGLPFLFRLITLEIGAKPTKYNGGALVCLMLIGAYWVSKDFSHREATRELMQNRYSTALRIGAMPKVFNPFAWYGIVETESAYHQTEVGWGIFPDRFELKNKIYHKPEQAEIVAGARKGPQAQIFLDFARFPLFVVEPSDQGYSITLRDLRFNFATRRRRGFVCNIELDKRLQLISENFHF